MRLPSPDDAPPELNFIGGNGHLRRQHFGEGDYERSERTIRTSGPRAHRELRLARRAGWRTRLLYTAPSRLKLAYLLEGEGLFGANSRIARPPQLVLKGPGEGFTITHAAPRTRYLLMAGQPHGEKPIFNGPFVDFACVR